MKNHKKITIEKYDIDDFALLLNKDSDKNKNQLKTTTR